MINPKKTKKQHQYLRNYMTKWKVRLWNDLKGKKMLGFKVRRQYDLENYIVDFYCPALKHAIEIDGDVHYFEEDYEIVIHYPEDIFRDRAKEFKIELNENF